jgi:hypothetical protein
MFSVPNLVSTKVTKVLPWEFTPEAPIPAEVRTDKTARTGWISAPVRKHCCYSLFEGLTEGQRISKGGKGSEGNPPHKLHGWAADVDEPLDKAELLKRCQALKPFYPSWLERTLSGNWRLIWLFEAPLLLPSYDFAIFFQKEILNLIPFKRLSSEFDGPAWKEPNRYYTTSCDWEKLPEHPFPQKVLEGFLVTISGKYEWAKHATDGPAVPVEAVVPLLRERYPKFAEWPGEFAEGAQGPTFWVDGSTSPLSAIVRATGIQTFSAHASKAFYSWADLVGKAPLERFEADFAGKAVEGIYFDGRHYWRKLERGDWKSFERGDLSMHLRVARGVSPKGEPSPLDRCLIFLQEHRHIECAGPVVFQPDGPLPRDPMFLNTSTRRVLQPAESEQVWGEAGEFPTLSKFFDGFFAESEHPQLPHFLAWFRWAYAGFLKLEAQPGHVIIIAGKAAVGKTFLNRGILGLAFGGFAEAQAYLTGNDNFNAELFRAGHWPVDDSSAASSTNKHRLWTEALKRAVANTTHRFNEKFKTAGTVEWQGRVTITCNDDEESMRILPDLGCTVTDKVMLFVAADVAPIKFPDTYQERVALLRRELPSFLRWLIDWTPPVEVMDPGTRYGVKPYHHVEIVRRAQLSSPVSGFNDILEDWKATYFEREKDTEFWEGTAIQLQRAIAIEDPVTQSIMREYSTQRVGNMLAGLKSRDGRVEIIDRGSQRFYRIYRPGLGS